MAAAQPDTNALTKAQTWVSIQLQKGEQVTAIDLISRYGCDPQTAQRILDLFESRRSSTAHHTVDAGGYAHYHHHHSGSSGGAGVGTGTLARYMESSSSTQQLHGHGQGHGHGHPTGQRYGASGGGGGIPTHSSHQHAQQPHSVPHSHSMPHRGAIPALPWQQSPQQGRYSSKMQSSPNRRPIQSNGQFAGDPYLNGGALGPPAMAGSAAGGGGGGGGMAGVSSASVGSAGDEMPLGWAKLKDEKGYYYFNVITSEVSRERPHPSSEPQISIKQESISVRYEAASHPVQPVPRARTFHHAPPQSQSVHPFPSKPSSSVPLKPAKNMSKQRSDPVQRSARKMSKEESEKHDKWDMLVDALQESVKLGNQLKVFKALRAVASNLLKADIKFRTLYAANRRVQERILSHDGGYEFLLSLGFKEVRSQKLVCESPNIADVYAAITVLEKKVALLQGSPSAFANGKPGDGNPDEGVKESPADKARRLRDAETLLKEARAQQQLEYAEIQESVRREKEKQREAERSRIEADKSAGVSSPTIEENYFQPKPKPYYRANGPAAEPMFSKMKTVKSVESGLDDEKKSEINLKETDSIGMGEEMYSDEDEKMGALMIDSGKITDAGPQEQDEYLKQIGAFQGGYRKDYSQYFTHEMNPDPVIAKKDEDDVESLFDGQEMDPVIARLAREQKESQDAERAGHSGKRKSMKHAGKKLKSFGGKMLRKVGVKKNSGGGKDKYTIDDLKGLADKRGEEAAQEMQAEEEDGSNHEELAGQQVQIVFEDKTQVDVDVHTEILAKEMVQRALVARGWSHGMAHLYTLCVEDDNPESEEDMVITLTDSACPIKELSDMIVQLALVKPRFIVMHKDNIL